MGTSLESYDFYAYTFFSALFAGRVFFEPLGAVGGTLVALLSIGIAFLVRPIGALIFGPIGDRLGRKRTLILTITIMGVSTGLIGCLPDYHAIGAFAPALLVFLRLVQGISLGGEWGGAVLLASEHSTKKSRAFAASLPQLGSPVGSFLAGGALLLMSSALPQDALLTWGWRIPFLVAFPFLLVSLWLRLAVSETPEFALAATRHELERVPIAAVFTREPLRLVVAIGAALLGIGSYSLMNTYMITYGSTVLHFKATEVVTATQYGALVQFVTIPLFGWLATKIGSARVVALGALLTALIAFPMYFWLQFASFGVLVATMLIGGVLPTLAWAALGGLMKDLFDTATGYTALSLAYAVAATISGFVPGLTDLLGIATGGAWWHPAIVLAVMSLITLASAIAAHRMRDRDPLANDLAPAVA